MEVSGLSIEDLFSYHPCKSEARVQAHQAINDAALAFAQVVDANIHDQTTKGFALFAIQQARMFANQGATIDELKGEKG